VRRTAREDFKVAGKDRAKQLARQKYERQAARRAAQARRARRVQIIGGVAAVVVLGGVGGGVAVALKSGDSKTKASSSPSASASASPAAGDGAPKLAITLQSVTVGAAKSAGTAKCTYAPSTTDKGAPKGLGTPPTTPAYKGQVPVTVKTNLGTLGLTLDATKAPCTTNSFAYLAAKKYFNNTKCHRLTTGGAGTLRVLQCGDPTATGSGGPGYKFANENTTGAKYTRGVLAMANAGANTNGSQFFIVYGDSTELPADYTIFGKVTTGMDVVDRVAKAGAAAQ
jgi:peptidyl-prolyl cis-trans isomerase B (cyclophilin B)